MKSVTRRRLWKWGGALLGCLGLTAFGLVLNAYWVLDRSYSHVAAPAIAADRSAAGLERGEFLFQSICAECHSDSEGRAIGKPLFEVPAFLGKFYSANLAHPEHGVHRRSEAELARVLRFGILPDGRLSPVMSVFGKLGDEDVAALIGYMHSGAPEFTPGGAEQPHTELSLVGRLILTYVAGTRVDPTASRVVTPPKAPTVEYGRYMAHIMDCASCHTEGFAADKAEGPGAFAGGFELTDPTGTGIWTKNITFDEDTGIGRWSVDDLERALTRGVTPDGMLVRKPMPLFARFDRTDVEALYAFLQALPRVTKPNRSGGHPLQPARPDDSAEALFVNVGCATCHGEQALYREQLRGALDKPIAEVAAWILEPQAIKQGSIMPAFKHVIDEAQARELARYVKQIMTQPGG